jgi:lipid-A-disaccharide synthase
MRYYLIAGERSGDLHGGNLLRSMRKHDPSMVARGFGGDDMRKAGMELTVHYDQLAFMGFVAVIANFRRITSLIRQCKHDITQFKPDVIILIDYAGFNMRIAKFAKASGMRVFYYISPKVWAWNTGRAWKLKALVDRMFCILPFEKEFFRKFDWEVDYVGSPVLDAVKQFQRDPGYANRNNLSLEKKVIALLPGSRRMELARMIPAMAQVVQDHPQYQFVVAAVKTLQGSLYAPFDGISNVKLVFDSTYDLLSVSTAAIVTSGTATLETALFGVPQAVIYRAGYLEMKLLKSLVKVKFISLPNLIADDLVIKEFIQDDMNSANLNAELDLMVSEGEYREIMLSKYKKIWQLLDTGSASENAARLMTGYLSVADTNGVEDTKVATK